MLAWAEPARVHFSGSAVGVGVTVHPPRRALKPTLGQGGALAHPACQRCFLRRSRCRRIGRAPDAGKSGYASSAARGHSCPQQLPNALSSPENSRTLSSLKLSADRNVRAPLNRYKTGAANKSCSRTGARKTPNRPRPPELRFEEPVKAFGPQPGFEFVVAGPKPPVQMQRQGDKGRIL